VAEQVAEQVFAPRAESVHAARHFLADELVARDVPRDWATSALLALSEVTTTMVRCAPTAVTVRIRWDDRTLRVEVEDDVHEAVVRREWELRGDVGLDVFRAVTHAWGYERLEDPGLTRVWFELARADVSRV
jgi:hypothetical protein